MLIDALRNPRDDAYWQLLAYSVPASLSSQKIRDAWLNTVRANPALRTRVVWNAEQSGQIIEEGNNLALDSYDWRREAEQGLTLEEWCQTRMEELKIQCYAGAAKGHLP